MTTKPIVVETYWRIVDETTPYFTHEPLAEKEARELLAEWREEYPGHVIKLFKRTVQVEEIV